MTTETIPAGLKALEEEVIGKQKLFREAQSALNGLTGDNLTTALADLQPKADELTTLERQYKDWMELNAREMLQLEAPAMGGRIGNGSTQQINRQADFEWGIFRSEDGGVSLPVAPRNTGLTPGEIFVRSAGYRERPLDAQRVMIPELTDQVFRADFYLGSLTNRDNETGRPFMGTVLAPAQPPGALDLIPRLPVTKTRTQWLLETRRIVGDGGEATRTDQRQDAQIAEGAVAPEANFAFDTQDVILRHVAHTLPISEEMIMSEPELVAIVNSEMGAGVRELLSEAIVRDNGTSNTISGFAMARTGQGAEGIAAYATGNTGLKVVTALGNAIDSVMYTGRAMPSAALIAPTVWSTVRDARTDEAGWIYVHPAATDPARIHGVPIVQSTEIGLTGAGNQPAANDVLAIVGAFTRFARLFTMGDVTVETGLNADDWSRYRRTVRAGMWAELVIQRTVAFVVISMTS